MANFTKTKQTFTKRKAKPNLWNKLKFLLRLLKKIKKANF